MEKDLNKVNKLTSRRTCNSFLFQHFPTAFFGATLNSIILHTKKRSDAKGSKQKGNDAALADLDAQIGCQNGNM